MRKIKILLISVCSFITFNSLAQELKEGFDKNEYLSMMYIYNNWYNDTSYFSKFPLRADDKLLFRSKISGLDNCWELWQNKNTAIISIRGTTSKSISWMENFYAAMVAAKGSIKIHGENINYNLSEHPNAAVHLGWLVGMLSMAKDIKPKIDSLNAKGIKDYIIIGHSQGGAISYLFNSQMREWKNTGVLDKDVRVKTYCSAAPKPGNLYYAYDYENYNRSWAYNVINAADWVPETPMSVQTIDDYNKTNPFANADAMIKKQKIPARWALRRAYNKMNDPAQKTKRNYQRYLGNMVGKIVKENLADYKSPDYYNSNNYVRTGNSITLYPDAEYYQLFPDDKNKVFIHHMAEPYIFLMKKW